MTREGLIKCLRYCVASENYDTCKKCPFREEREYDEDTCSDDLMLIAAEMLEQEG